MRITVKELHKLIKEEVKKLEEQDFTGGGVERPILSGEEMQEIQRCRSTIQAILQRIVDLETRQGGQANAQALRTHIRNLVAMETDLHDKFHV